MLDINDFIAERGGNPEKIKESQRRRHAPVEAVDDPHTHASTPERVLFSTRPSTFASPNSSHPRFPGRIALRIAALLATNSCSRPLTGRVSSVVLPFCTTCAATAMILLSVCSSANCAAPSQPPTAFRSAPMTRATAFTSGRKPIKGVPVRGRRGRSSAVFEK
ncbi:hypothetical protein BJ546DRAFT_1002804 [Cryomyces antarcticus]